MAETQVDVDGTAGEGKVWRFILTNETKEQLKLTPWQRTQTSLQLGSVVCNTSFFAINVSMFKSKTEV